MKRWVGILVAIGMFMFLGCLLSSKAGGGLSDDDTSNNDDDTDDCENNHAPELLEISYFINDDPIVELPPFINSDDYENFNIRLAYKDEDCNLDGGSFFITLGEGEPNEGKLKGELGCSSDATGRLYRIDLADVFENPSGGEYECRIWWTDVCKEKSNELEFTFTIQ